MGTQELLRGEGRVLKRGKERWKDRRKERTKEGRKGGREVLHWLCFRLETALGLWAKA